MNATALILIALIPMLLRADAIDDLGQPIAPDRVFYRWQSTVAGDNLTRAGRMTAALDRHFMAHDGAAGPGLYIAGTPTSSAMYLPKEGGNLIEVHLDRDVPLIDLTDLNTVNRMKAAGVGVDDLLAALKSGRPAVLKYKEDWFVGRNLSDRAEFKSWPGPAARADDVVDVIRRLGPGLTDPAGGQRAETAIARQVLAHRPDLARGVAARGHLNPTLLGGLSPNDVVGAIEDHVKRWGELTWDGRANALRWLAADPGAVAKLGRAPATFDRVANALNDDHARRYYRLDDAEWRAVRELSLGRGADPAARARRIAALVEVAVRDDAAWTSAGFAADRVRPLLDASTLTPAQQTQLHSRISRLVSTAGPLDADDADHLVALARHAGAGAASLTARVDGARRTPADTALADACALSVARWGK